MKKFLYISVSIISFLFFFLSCTKDLDIQESFDFQIQAIYQAESYIGISQPMQMNVLPEREIDGVIYSLSYQIMEGDGILNSENEPLAQNTFYSFTGLQENYNYIGRNLGMHKILLSIQDNYERRIDTLLTFQVNDIDFTWDASSPVSELAVNDTISLNVNLFYPLSDADITFERKYYVSQGQGTILDENNNVVNPNEFEDIEPGTYNYRFTTTEPGETKIMFEARDSNNQIKKDSIVFNAENIEFSFSATAQQSNLFAGENTNINMNITETNGNGGTYQIKYEINPSSDGSIRLSNGGQNIIPGFFRAISVGDFSWQVEALEEGSVDVEITVRNNTGIESVETVSFQISDGGFILNAETTQNTAVVNEQVPININIQEEGSSHPPYKLTFSSSGNGELTFNGQTITAGQFITGITQTNFTVLYKGTSAQNHSIELIASNSNVPADTNSDTVNIDFENVSYAFTGAPEINSLLIGETTNLNFDITENPPVGSQYEMKYVFSNGNAVITSGGAQRNPGIYYAVSLGSFAWQMKAITPGNVQMLFTVRNRATNEEQSIVLNVTVEDINFTFSGTPEQNVIILGQNTNLNFDITENPPVGSQYEMKFVFNSGNANITSSGSQRNPGIFYPVSIGYYSWKLQSTQVGTVQMTFTVRNLATQEQESISLSIVVENTQSSDFTFNAIPTTTTDNIGNPILINFNITEVQGPPSNYSMIYTSNNNGSFYYQGISYAPGQTIPNVPAGNFTGAYIGSQNGNHDIEFIVTNSASVTHSKEVHLIFETDFTFIATINGSGGTNGMPFPVDFNIAQQGTDGSVNYIMVFSSNKPATITIDGVSYSQGQSIPVIPGAFSGTYLSNLSGTHDVTFIVTNNNVNPISHSDNITFTLF